MSEGNASLILPPALRPGDTLGIVAPSSRVDPEKLAAGVAALERWGYRAVVAPHVLERRGHLAGDDAGRAADLVEMFRRPDVQGVICARGGAGSARLLPLIDFAALPPKVFIGYSDVTMLHLGFQRAGLVTFFGAMVAVEFAKGFPPPAEQALRRLIEHPEPAGLLGDPERPATPLVPGAAEGPLAGGTLTLLCDALGTPWEVDTAGKILFLEDVHEPLYRVDLMLNHLKQAGKLAAAAGFLIGRLHDESLDPEEPLGIDQVFADHLLPLGKPTAIGFPAGHVPGPLPIPLGVRAGLEVGGEVSVRILQPCVRSQC